jgi:DNA repair and recombination protein RAD54B
MGKTMFNSPLLPGSTLGVGGKEVEVDSLITKVDYLAGRPFLKMATKKASSSEEHTKLSLSKPQVCRAVEKSSGMTVPAKSFYAPPPKTLATQGHFKNPLLTSTVNGVMLTPRHDPNAPGALVMKRPRDCPNGKQIVDVVLDPLLGDRLRPHQREGVKFLYECVMGMRPFNGQGALLADEMGLGKTLTTIALLWTLLKQNPINGCEGVIRKALIVCPVTLINNWKREFKIWLGNERIGVFVADSQKHMRLTDFTHGKSYSVMIIGYEKLRSVQDELVRGGGIDIVVADEGHRLKTAQNKSAQAIKALNTPRRIILSGTPMQNDLSEFFVMVDFVNPGTLGSYNTFKKEFEGPIMKSRQPGASAKDIEKGTARQEELFELTGQFILRRSASILKGFLPPKTEYVLFCKPTRAQAEVYQYILQSPMFGKVLGSPEASLQLITMLKKVCNSPILLSRRGDKEEPTNNNVTTLLTSIPSSILDTSPLAGSSKIRFLDRMLRKLSEETSEKVVLVSNYTATLDILAQHLSSLSLPYLRLDGSTPAAKRQAIVDTFNKTCASENFAFLLSAKSGGAGINLIGASRLILFDVDWNPATDLQAMARIHRDGQKRPVKIYRLMMSGGMDEKIYQRQITKMGLADSVVDGKKNDASFSAEELRDLFRLNLQASCQTHDLLGCSCNGRTLPLELQPSTPEHVNISNSGGDGACSDDLLLSPNNPAFVPASKANIAAMSQRIIENSKKTRKKQTEGKMQALMEYSHLDTSIFAGETMDVFGYELDEVIEAKQMLGDEVLSSVLQESNCKVSYVFVKKG